MKTIYSSRPLLLITILALNIFQTRELKAQSPVRMIIASDPQPFFGRNDADYVFEKATKKRPEGDDYKDAIRANFKKIVSDVKAIQNLNGIIINGDLTNSWQKNNGGDISVYLEEILDPLKAAGISYYAGLGNHDVYKNDGTVGLRASLSYIHMVRFIDKISPPILDKYRDGINYAFRHDNYLFVQSNISPFHSYKINPGKEVNSTFEAPVNSDTYDKFLRKMNRLAREKGYKIVLNFHAYGSEKYGWSPENLDAFKSWAAQSEIVAIFVGHTHGILGLYELLEKNNGSTIPVFYSGAMHLGSYLDVSFEEKKIVVTPKIADTKYGTNEFSDCEKRPYTHYFVQRNRFIPVTKMNLPELSDNIPWMVGNLTQDKMADILYITPKDGMMVIKNPYEGDIIMPFYFPGHKSDFSKSWSTKHHNRLLSDTQSDGYDDMIGLANSGIYLSLNKLVNSSDPQSQRSFEISTRRSTFTTAVENGAKAFQVMMGDTDGDGLKDLIRIDNNGVTYSRYLAGSFNQPIVWTEEFKVLNRNLNTMFNTRNHYELGMVNNDNKADLIIFSNQGVRVALAGTSGFNRSTQWLAPPDNSTFGEPTIRTGLKIYKTKGDFNADGKTDVISIGTKVEVGLSNGRAFELKKWTPHLTRHLYRNCEDVLWRVGDANGDGKDDIFAIGREGVNIILSPF